MNFEPADGSAPLQSWEVFDFLAPGVAMSMYNVDDSIEGFARSCFNYAMARNYPLYMSTKNTILKQYDGKFIEIFQRVYDQSIQEGFRSPQAVVRTSPDRRYGRFCDQVRRRVCLGV